jgi:carboxymethylenebutenolidase
MRITLPSGTPAEFAQPDGPPTMGLVIAPDIFGLRPLYDDLVARLARDWNMSVCAVEPFPGRDLGPDIGPRSALVASIDDALHFADLEAAADQLAMRSGVGRVGLLGFCLGGMYCHKAARSDRFDRIVSFYGMIRVPGGWQSATQAEPLDILAAGHADRVLAVIGELDPYTPPDDVVALESVGVATVRYPQAEHGFAHDPARPAHRSDDAADAFARSRVWLEG